MVAAAAETGSLMTEVVEDPVEPDPLPKVDVVLVLEHKGAAELDSVTTAVGVLVLVGRDSVFACADLA